MAECTEREDSQGCADPREDRVAVEHGHACKRHTLHSRHLVTFTLALLQRDETLSSQCTRTHKRNTDLRCLGLGVRLFIAILSSRENNRITPIVVLVCLTVVLPQSRKASTEQVSSPLKPRRKTNGHHHSHCTPSEMGRCRRCRMYATFTPAVVIHTLVA